MARKAAKAQAQSANERARYWGDIFYPESLPENWENLLCEKFQLQWAASPLHDKDVDENGNLKKPHYHVIFYFAGKKSFSQVKEITDFLNQPQPQIIKNHVGAFRYFFHIDNPEKAQYNLTDFKAYGIDVLNIIKLSGDKQNADDACYAEIENIISSFHHSNLQSLLSHLENNCNIEVLRFFRNHYGYFRSLVDAEYQIKQAEKMQFQLEMERAGRAALAKKIGSRGNES